MKKTLVTSARGASVMRGVIGLNHDLEQKRRQVEIFRNRRRLEELT